MKLSKSNYIVGAVAAIFCVLGSLFKIMHYPGASIILILGVAIFNFGFVTVFLIRTLKGLKNKSGKATHIVGALALLLCSVGLFLSLMKTTLGGILLTLGTFLFIARMIMPFFTTGGSKKLADYLGVITFLLIGLALLFRVQHYPGTSMLLLLGAFSFCAYLPIYLTTKYDELAETNNTGILSLIIIGTVFLSLILPATAPRGVYGAFVQINRKIIEQTEVHLTSTEDLYKKFDIWPDSDSVQYRPRRYALEVRDQSNLLCAYMEDLKLALIIRIQGNVSPEHATGLLRTGKYDKGDADKSAIFFINEGNGRILRAELSKLREVHLSYLNDDKALVASIEKLLNTDDPQVYADEPQHSWESEYFEYLPSAAVIANLSQMQSNVRSAEYLVVNHLWNSSEVVK